MPTNFDILIERLRHYDEVTLLELLDIDADDLLAKFADRVRARKDYLLAEVEIMNIDDPELDDEDEFDGYQIEEVGDEEN